MGKPIVKKVVKKASTPKKVKEPVMEVGSLVRVVTVYRVKRMPSHANGEHLATLIAVEDQRLDRVIHFRREELELVKVDE
jgi:hypothetical protein